MSPGKLFLVFIGISSVFFSEAQDQAKNISSSSRQYKEYTRPPKQSEPRCSCNVSPQIVPVSRVGTTWTYQGIPNATCSGGIITSPDKAEDTCGVKNVTWSWSVASGSSVAEISGSNTSSTVDIQIKGNGSFTLNLVNGVTCNDSSSCSYYAYYTDSAHVDSSHCTCTAGPVTIQPTNRQGNTWTYQGNVQGNCTGQYGVSPNLNSCGVQITMYQWSISGSGASIQGNSSGQSVNVQVSANAKFNLRLDGTTICSDGKNCTNYNFYEDSVKNDTARHCQCDVASAKIDPINRHDSTVTYGATVVGSCTGVHGIEPNVDSCHVQTITYDWFISAGMSVAEILGPTNGSTVTVFIKKEGAFTLDVAGDVICSDSNKCHYVTYVDDSLRKNKCELSFNEDVLPKMDGGLKKFFGPKEGRMARDEFIVLEAEGKDIDKLILHCTPASGCEDTKSNRTIFLNGRVRFEWKIEGEGNFVKLGCLPDGVKKDEGEHVIFQPPFVPLPTPGNESSVSTTIILSIIDDNPTQPLDEKVDRKITIVTKRFLTSPDEYVVDIKSDLYALPKPDVPTQDVGTCKPVHAWEMNKDLKTPEVELPGVPDNDKMVVGELIVLKAVDQRDPDKLKMVCQGTKCDNDGNEKVYEDDVQWTWTILNNNSGTNGRIVGQDKGRFVVYEAPNKLPKDASFITVTIQVTVENPNALPKIADEKFSKQFTLLVYQGGIKMEYPPLEWLPTENGSVQVKSSLTYLDGKTWKPSLAHQCRIHFFEMKQVSDEPGVCMNEPTPDKADDCRDLYIKNESDQEAFNDAKTGKKCTLAELFQEARSKKPLREYSITIYSRDFGASGFLFSRTRKNAEYLSVPVQAEDVTHPDGKRKKKTIYKDNRINLPRDIDENKIADWGWDVSPTLHMADPIDNKADDDATPQGDKFPGDGLTTFEEYRGFRVMGGEDFVHIRTSILHKDLFVRNRDVLKLDLFKAQSGLQVHEITPEQYVNDNTRIINFNKSGDVHLIDQLGIFLLSAPDDGNLLGIADTPDKQPAPPNGVIKVRVMVGKIRKFCQDRKMNATDEQAKIEQVTAHELAHACNVYHHGEGDPAVEGSLNILHGIRSGNMSCIMRYDNLEANHLENIGSIFCTSADATGSNLTDPQPPAGRGFREANTTLCRGNCAGQFRISSRGKVPKRLTPQQCRQNNQ